MKRSESWLSFGFSFAILFDVINYFCYVCFRYFIIINIYSKMFCDTAATVLYFYGKSFLTCLYSVLHLHQVWRVLFSFLFLFFGGGGGGVTS